MSRYAYLVSKTTRTYVWLGKIVGEEAPYRFAIGDGQPPNSENPQLCKIVMKFLGEHLGQGILLLAEEEFDELDVDETSPYREVGATEPAEGITAEEYLDGFRG